VSAAVALVPAAAQASERVSNNWAGYVAAPRHARDKFSSVSGTWVVPAATCSTRREAFSAVWVGLGGYHENAQGLEQLGTEQDCGRNGIASYAAWFEILPASRAAIKMNVHPGDTVSASTTVAGRSVTFRHPRPNDRRPLLIHAPRACHRRVERRVDRRGALRLLNERQVHRPGARQSEHCRVRTRNSHIGKADETGGRRGVVEHDGQARASLTLPGLPFHAEAEAQKGPTRTLVTAAPSPPAAPYGAFSVSLTEQTTQLPVPSIPTLPGFGRR
jgi:hypothetical protein